MAGDVLMSPAAILRRLADDLNQLQALGVNATARYGCVLTDHGFLMPSEAGTWSVRLKIHDPEYLPSGDPDDD